LSDHQQRRFKRSSSGLCTEGQRVFIWHDFVL